MCSLSVIAAIITAFYFSPMEHNADNRVLGHGHCLHTRDTDIIEKKATDTDIH